MVFTLAMPLEPEGKKAPSTRIIFPRDKRKKPFAVIYTTAQTRKYEAQVKALAVSAMRKREIFEGPLTVVIEAIFPVPKTWSGVKWTKAVAGVIRPTGKPDGDNISKIIGDALNGVVWHDDAQVVDLRVRKFYGKTPSITVTVRETEIGLLEVDEEAA